MNYYVRYKFSVFSSINLILRGLVPGLQLFKANTDVLFSHFKYGSPKDLMKD